MPLKELKATFEELKCNFCKVCCFYGVTFEGLECNFCKVQYSWVQLLEDVNTTILRYYVFEVQLQIKYDGCDGLSHIYYYIPFISFHFLHLTYLTDCY